MNETPCFTDFAIQEYLLGRLDARVREELDAHLEGCLECAACVKLLAGETAALRSALRAPEGTELSSSEIDDETLAGYLDGGLRPEEREGVERALAESPGTLMRLNALRIELEAIFEVSHTNEAPVARPEGRVLRMRKRRVIPRKLSDLSAGNSEAAEG